MKVNTRGINPKMWKVRVKICKMRFRTCLERGPFQPSGGYPRVPKCYLEV